MQTTLEVPIPDKLYASIRLGKSIRVRYELVVELDVAWARDVAVRLPILLIEKPGEPSGGG